MIITDRNFYIIKQSEGTTWNFSFSKDQGIIYKFFKENTWSEYHVLSENASKNFSVILLPDDSINVLYQDLTGTIILNKYEESQWNKHGIITNKRNDIFDIYFKTVINDNKIQIFFSILNTQNNLATLFHQSLDENNNLSNPKIIDIIKYNYSVPFILYSVDNKELFIMYQRLMNSHEIGYKIFNKNIDKWSDFNLIDRSIYPFKDYSAIMVNGILHALYIIKEKNIDTLIYVHGNNFNNTKLFQEKNIDSCLIFIIYSEIWCFCIVNNKIYSNFSIDNGHTFGTIPYELSINSPYVSKNMYISNNPKEQKCILGNEIYITNDNTLQCLTFSTLYPYTKDNQMSDRYLSYIEYYITEIYLKVSSYKNTFILKEQLIAQLKYQLEEQKAQILLYERKFESINKSYTKFIDLKNELSKNINLLQQSLIYKQDKINLLKNINMEKENEICFLKKQLFHEKNKFKKINIAHNKFIDTNNKLNRTVNLLQQDLIDKEENLNLLKNINMEKEKEICSLKEKLSKEENIILFLMSQIKNLKNKIRIMYTKNYKKHNMY